jgi:hypothetical protein
LLPNKQSQKPPPDLTMLMLLLKLLKLLFKKPKLI